ncbi:MAG: hypothetical protein AB1765_06755 [Candidatus Hydrogenedentota bacterium]
MRIFKRVIIIIAGLFVGFTLLEILCRQFMSDYSIVLPMYENDPEIGPLLKKISLLNGETLYSSLM